MSEFHCSDCGYQGQWAGLVQHDRQNNCNNDLKQLVIDEFQKIVSKINKVPTRAEFDKHSRISKNSAVSKFDDCYNNLIIKAGFEPNKSFQIEKEDLIKEIQRLDNEYKVVSRRLMKEESLYSPDTCEDRFGSWNNALKESGVGINEEHTVTKEKYLQEIKRLKRELDEVPTGHQMNKYGKHPAKSYNDKFGTYNKAVEKAGFEPRYKQYASGEDSHAYGIKGKDHPRYGSSPNINWKENEKTGHNLRSGWEYEYDNLLYQSNLKHEYESERFYFEEFTYLPDFFIGDDFIVEVKGWANQNSFAKGEAIMKELDKRKYIVVGSEASKEIESDCWFSWENREDSIEYMENDITGV